MEHTDIEGVKNKNYKIVVKKVDINNLKIVKTNPKKKNVTKKKLTLLRPQDGTQRKPVKYSGPIIWQCLGCENSTTFTVTAKYVGNKTGVKTVRKKTTASNIRLKYPESGPYQITVSGNGLRSKSSFIQTKESSPSSYSNEGEGRGNGFLLLILLLMIGGITYYFLKMRPNKNPDSTIKRGESRRIKIEPQDEGSDDLGRF